MAATFFILKLAPPEIRALPPHDRLAFQSVVVEFALRRKDWELARGLNAKGEPLPPVSAETRKYRRSEMTPTGRGDPSAPYLMPGRRLSRTRSLLTGKAHADYAEFGWRFDPYTADQWGKILAIHARRGTDYDVVGLSVKGQAWVKAKALAAFRAWKAGEAPLPLPAAPRSAVAADVPVDVVGMTNLDHAVGGIGDGSVGESKRAIAEGRSTGFLTIDEWKKRWRSKAPAVAPGPGVPHSIRKGASNVLLRRVWPGSGPGQPPPAAPPVAPVKPKPKPKPKPAPVVKTTAEPPPPRAAKAGRRPKRVMDPNAVPPVGLLEFASDASDELKTAATKEMEAIGKVHLVAGFPAVKVSPNAAGATYNGRYDPSDHAIESIAGSSVTQNTIAHEFGHMVDDLAVCGLQWSSAAIRGQEIADWLSAAFDSARIKELRKTYSGLTDEEDRKYVGYLLSPIEIWARAYGQWIATASGDADARKSWIARAALDETYNAHHWDEGDFEPLAEAFRAIFGKKGWLVADEH